MKSEVFHNNTTVVLFHEHGALADSCWNVNVCPAIKQMADVALTKQNVAIISTTDSTPLVCLETNYICVFFDLMWRCM